MPFPPAHLFPGNLASQLVRDGPGHEAFNSAICCFNSFDLFCEPLSVWLGSGGGVPTGDIAKDEKEAKKWANAEKSMEAKMHRKRTLDNRGKSVLGQCHHHHQCLLHPSHSCPPGLLSLEDPPMF